MEKYLEREEKTVDSSKKSGHKSIKGIIIFLASSFALGVVFSLLVLYKPMSSLEGDWVRLPDDNVMANGMVITIKNQNGQYVGEVVAIDDESGMPIGTLKWQGFHKDALNVFAYNDMTLAVNANDRYYGLGYALMSLDRTKLTLYGPFASTGRHQVWVKRKQQ